MAFNIGSDSDRTFFASVTQEAIRTFGIDIEYWTTTFDAQKDPIYDEDSKPLINGRYKLKAHTTLIQEDTLMSRFGLSFITDSFRISIDEKEFNESVGGTPYPGDYVWINYMNRLYIVSNVDKEDNIFLQKKFVWNIDLKVADLAGEEVSANLDLPDYETMLDNQNDNSAITEAISGFIKEKIGDKSIFGTYE